MRGTGAVTIDRGVVYAYFTADPPRGRVLVRVSADDCDRLDLFAGRQVVVALPGQPAAPALLVVARSEPPFVWIEFELTAAARGLAG
jgi:hypothetical protein